MILNFMKVELIFVSFKLKMDLINYFNVLYGYSNEDLLKKKNGIFLFFFYRVVIEFFIFFC